MIAAEMNAKLGFVLFVASALALVESDLVTVKVKGRKYKPFDTPKYCITRYNPFKEKPGYHGSRRFNVYDQLLKCNEDSACLGIVIGGDAGTMAVGKTRGTTTGDDDRGYLKIAGDTCPEGAVPYEPPEDVYSKNFCQHENRSCEAERMTDGPIKTKNADYCMKKCIALPECTGINYLENKKITKRCELLQGYCRAREMRGFYGMTHYRRLGHLRGADCSNEPVLAPYCAAGDVEVVSDTFQESGSRDPTAQCPDQHVVTHCECSVGLRDSECGGTRINRDMTTCTAIRHYKGRYIRARACCRAMKENIVPYYHSTYLDALTCPTKTVAHCVANGDERAIDPSEDISMTSTSDPRTCRLLDKLAWKVSLADIQAVCLATYEMEVFDERECIESEHAVEGGSVAACEEGWYVSHCLCEGDQCTGTSTTSDASTCTAHGQAGAAVKARACCTKLGDGEKVAVASKPEHGTSRAPYADCPYGGSPIACLITSTSGSWVYADGTRCWTPYSCLDCRVQIICTREQPPPRPFECADGERELLGGEKDISYSPKRHSSVQCGLDEYMTRCECEEAEGECYNVGIETIDLQPDVYPETKYAFACSVYGGKRNAQACCRKREEGVKYNVQSAPKSMSFVHYVSSWSRYTVRGREGPSASCWSGYQVLYCNLYKTPHDAFVGEEPIIEGNRCYASGFCANCAIDVVCRSKKFEPSVPTKAPEDQKECGPYETEVFGAVAGSYSMSEATCPESMYVARCDAVKVETKQFCGTSVTKDGMTCRAMPVLDSRQKAKARACCKKLRTNESVYVVSDPNRMYEFWRYPATYIRSAYGRSSFIECPEKTELVTCMVDGGRYYGGGPTMQREGNGCSATGGVMAVCKGGKKWIEKVKG